MVSLLEKDAFKRERRQLRSGIYVLILAVVVLFCGGVILISAQSMGALVFSGSISTASVTPGSYSNVVECEGSVAPIRVTTVTSKTPGTVSSVAVHEGQYVRQGAVLFEMQDGEESPQPITASVSGTVMNVNVAIGMTSNELATLDYAMEIADMNVLVGIVKVPEFVSVLLDDGEYVSMTSSATPGVKYQGMLMGLSKEKTTELTNAGQALYDAKIMFDGIGALHVGDPLVARMDVEDYGQVFYVPASAVEEINGVSYVQIVRHNGTIEQHQVEMLGTEKSGQKIVKSDILTSETIVRTDWGK